MKNGAVLWDAVMEDYRRGYAATLAPLIVKDKVIVGIAGAEYPIRGFIEAYDAQLAVEQAQFYASAVRGRPATSAISPKKSPLPSRTAPLGTSTLTAPGAMNEAPLLLVTMPTLS